PLGGLPDLEARRLRFIGDAHDRIREDYLRILRFFRFHAWYGAPGIDAEGLAACAALADGLEQLSKERVGSEMLKLLGAQDPAPAMASMQACGVLMRILPGADAGLIAPLVYQEELRGLAPDAIRRLTALCGQIDGKELTAALRLTRAQAARFAQLRAALAADMAAGEAGYRLGAELGASLLALRAACGLSPAPGENTALRTGGAAKLPVSAADLMPDLSGAALGARLKQPEVKWVASGFALSRDQLLA
ncbi:MAG: CCA tRNA nucleotidyltransferase, partial [Rhodobacteraceae bacterium]|nr:CCA tRNA nucleotidyltransferase [Paracoccaceae bacterium]